PLCRRTLGKDFGSGSLGRPHRPPTGGTPNTTSIAGVLQIKIKQDCRLSPPLFDFPSRSLIATSLDRGQTCNVPEFAAPENSYDKTLHIHDRGQTCNVPEFAAPENSYDKTLHIHWSPLSGRIVTVDRRLLCSNDRQHPSNQ